MNTITSKKYSMHQEANEDHQTKKIPGKEAFYQEAFSRNLGLLTRSEQELLRNSKIAIPGMGGVGGLHLINLVRLGICNFHIADFDFFEIANINRQYGAKISNVYQSKVQTMFKEAKDVNPYANIQVFETAINTDNIDAFLEDVDVVVDSLDFFQIKARRLLFNKAREKGIYVITAGPMGFSTAMLIFAPDKMSFDSYFDIQDGMEEREMLFRFAIGLCPKATQFSYMDMNKVSFKSNKGPSLNLSCQLSTAAAAAEVIKILLGSEKVKPVPHYFQYDLWLNKFVKGYLVWGNKNPIQRLKLYLLKRKLNAPSTDLNSKAIEKNISGSSAINKILEAGILAPSGDNAQPWKFKASEDEICIYIDKEADRSFFNINQIASLISSGAALENMRIAASNMFVNTSVEYPTAGLSESKNLEEVVRLKLKKDGISLPDSLYRFISERHTNRTEYNRKAIPERDVEKIKNSIQDIEGVSLQIITDKDQKKQVAEFVYEADIIRTENQKLHEHLMKMIRFNDEEALKTRDGFHIKNLEAGIDGEIFLKNVRSWKRMNLVNKLGLGKKIAKVSKLGIDQSSAIGLIKINGRSIKDFIDAGRALERIWLTATGLGIDLQPTSILTLFWMNYQISGKNIFSDKHSKTLDALWKQQQSLFDISEKEGAFFFRIGYGKHVKVRTIRKEVKDFLI